MFDGMRGWGKNLFRQLSINIALASGQHIHRETRLGTICEGGDSECPLWEDQLWAMIEQKEEEE